MNWRLIKFIDDNAVLENENGKKITWPHNLLPVDYKIGDQFTINFNKIGESLPNNNEAKSIINTILKTD